MSHVTILIPEIAAEVPEIFARLEALLPSAALKPNLLELLLQLRGALPRCFETVVVDPGDGAAPGAGNFRVRVQLSKSFRDLATAALAFEIKSEIVDG